MDDTGKALLNGSIKMDHSQFGCFLPGKSILNLESDQTELGEKQLEMSPSILEPRISEVKDCCR